MHLCFSFRHFLSCSFVSRSIASDIVCYLYVPVQWLYFAASTYVWVQYVWHTGELSLCFTGVLCFAVIIEKADEMWPAAGALVIKMAVFLTELVFLSLCF